MKKIVIDARFWGPSHTGLGRYTQSLITALYQQKPKYEIVLLALTTKKRQLQQLFPRWQVVAVNCRHYSLAEQLQLPRILNRLQPDLVHFLHFNVPVFCPQPFLVTIHDLIKHHSRGLATSTLWPFVYPFKRLGYRLVIKQAVVRSQLILTPSSWVKQDIQSFFRIKPSKILLTPEAAEASFFKAGRPAKGLAPNEPYLIYVGNAYPHKNLIQLIKAIKKYNQKTGKKLLLVIVTAKDIFYQRLRQQLRQLNLLDLVKIKGFTNDNQLRGLYQQAQAFITASLFEGFGLPGLEAMAAKTLVLSSKRSSLPEVYGSHALYFNPDNLSSIVAAIDQALNLKDREQRLQAAQKYAQSFSWKKTAELTLKAYETCFCL